MECQKFYLVFNNMETLLQHFGEACNKKDPPNRKKRARDEETKVKPEKRAKRDVEPKPQKFETNTLAHWNVRSMNSILKRDLVFE